MGPAGAGGGGAGGSSEYVRNELRAVVDARAARPVLHTLQPPDLDLVGFDMPTPGQSQYLTQISKINEIVKNRQ